VLLEDWSFYTVIVCYIFLPLPTKRKAFALGALVTLGQLVLVTVDKDFDEGEHTVVKVQHTSKPNLVLNLF
jgi:hypothetical protein